MLQLPIKVIVIVSEIVHYAFDRRQQLGRSIGSYWGNANNWAYQKNAGLTVDNRPEVGAIFQTTVIMVM